MVVSRSLLVTAARGFSITGRQRCSSTTWRSSRMVRIELSKTNLLVDEPLKVVVVGLQPSQQVTMSALLEETNKVYASCGHFTSDKDGRVNLSTTPSQGGTYTGVSEMGLFWSMLPTPDMRRGERLMKDDVTTPLVTRLDVHSGHVSLPDPRHPPERPLVSAEVRRWYKSPDVDRIVVQDSDLIGTLFVPKGDGPYPGVVDVFGSVGGVVEFRAALLASRGFITFALGYISYGEVLDVKKDIEYYEKAVNLLRNHPRVEGKGIGMIGTSKGAEVCLLTSVFNPNVKAVVSIGGSPWVTGFDHAYKGRTVPATGLFTVQRDGKYAHDIIDGTYELVDTEEGMSFSVHPEKASPKSAIPVEKTHAKLLFVSGDDDPCVPDNTSMILARRLRDADREEACTVIRYPRAGHLLEPPYAPHCRVGYFAHLRSYFVWGGYTQEHARAQEDLWTRMLDFFNQTLSLQPPAPKL